MSTATLNDLRATHVRLSIPAYGLPWADVSLDSEASLSGSVALKVADLTVQCKVVSGGPAKGRSYYRVAAGAGWGGDIAAKSYANDLGVKTSTVLVDAATAAGETILASTLPGGTLGPAYVRESGPAGHVLQLLSPRNWYVGEDGQTRIGKRAASTYTGKGQLGILDLARGTVTIAAEEIATLLPGITVEGIEATDVLHEVSTDGLRSTIYGAGIASTSRFVEAQRRLFESLFPGLKYAHPVEYRVVSQEGERLNLQAVRVSVGMPDLRRVFVRPGVPGCRADVALGSRVLVQFIEGNPALPMVVAFEDAEGGGFVPTRLDLADAGGRVIRDGEVVAITDAVNPISLGVITLHPSMVIEGDPGVGYSRVFA